MNFQQRVTAVVQGSTSPATLETVGETHGRLYELLGVGGDFTTEVGVKLALCDAYPDAEIFARPDIAQTIAEFRAWVASDDFPPVGSLPWLDYILCRFAAVGNPDDLRELIRLVKHRDGSTAAIETGSEAAEVLRAGALELPHLESALWANGLDLAGDLCFGFLPRGSEAAALSFRPVKGTRVERSVAAQAPQAGTAAAEGLDDAPRPPLAVAEESGAVLILGQRFSIRDAAGIATEILDLVKVMLLPGPGYRWSDTGAESFLVLTDPTAPQAVRLIEQNDGGYIQADIDNSDSGYTVKVWGFGQEGGVLLADTFPDLAGAKYAAAEYVRNALKG